nr:formin-like protein 7 [Pogona vitticeps]
MPPPPSGPFSRCVVCSGKIPFQDGHDTCLFCLGESHSPQNCVHCQAFTKAALKARQQRLKLHLWNSALSASEPSSMELPSTSSASISEGAAPAVSKAVDLPPSKPSKKAPKKSSKTSSVAKPVKQTKAKGSTRSADPIPRISPIPPDIPSPILEDSSRGKDSTSGAATPLPPRQSEPAIPLGAPSLTPSQLVRITSSLGSAHVSPMSSGRASPAPSLSPVPSRSSSPRKKSEKRKHLSEDRHRSLSKHSKRRRHHSRRRYTSTSDDSSSSESRRRRHKRHSRRRSRSSSSSTSPERRHRHRKVKYIYLSSSSSSASTPPPKKRRRRHKRKTVEAPQPAPPSAPPIVPTPPTGSASTIPPPPPPPPSVPPTAPSAPCPRPKKTHDLSSDDDAPPSSQEPDSDEEPPPQPTPQDLPEGETVESDIGNPHDSFPSEDFTSYAQMLSRLAKTLKIPVDEPTPPEEDLIFGDITKDRSSPPSLSFLPALLKIVHEFWEHPSASVPLPKRTESMYKITGDDAKFLLKHPIPNSLIVETSCTKPSGKVHVIPTNKEGKKLELIGRRLYSLITFILRVANYQTALGAYQKQLWLKMLPGLHMLPDEARQPFLNTYEEAQTVSKHQRIATRHSVEAAARILVTAVTLRRHAWLRAANIFEDVKTKVEDLLFDSLGLFIEKTDTHLEDLHKAKKTAKSYYIQPQPKFNRFHWKRSSNQYNQPSQQFRQFKDASRSASSQNSAVPSTYRGHQPSQRRQSYKQPAKKHRQYL